MLHRKKPVLFLVLTLAAAFGVAYSVAQVPQESREPTPFEKTCSACHSLERIRLDMEKIIKEAHQQAGVRLSADAICDIEESFTLRPVEEPHKAIFREKCAECHSTKEVVLAHQTKDEAEMKAIIERMAAKEGSGITQEEIEKIHESMNMLNEIYEKDIEAKPEPKK